MTALARANVCAILATLVLVTLPDRAWATSSAIASPVTVGEQSARLAGMAQRGIGEQLFPRPVSVIGDHPYFQRDYRSQWLDSPPDRRARLAERIGEQGRARFAAERGWIKLLGSRRGLRQGPDAIYWDPYNGKVRVIEAKGGSSQARISYGARQGTNLNAVRSAELPIRSLRTTHAEKLQNARLLVAAQRGHLETGLVRTKHVLGRPNLPGLEGGWDRVRVAGEARAIEARLVRQDPNMAKVFREARRQHVYDISRYRLGRGVLILGFAGAPILGWDAFHHGQIALTMMQDASVRGTPLPILYAGIAIGRGAEAVAVFGLSAGQIKSLERVRYLRQVQHFGRFAGRGVLPIAVGVETMIGGAALYEYSMGRISQREFYRRITGPSIVLTFTGGGAAIGAGVGAKFFVVGAVPGAVIGATVGRLISIPVNFFADRRRNRSDGRLSDVQQHAVNRALDRKYGLTD